MTATRTMEKSNMPPPMDPCASLRQRIVDLRRQLTLALARLRNAPPGGRDQILQLVDTLSSQIEHEQALLQELDCDAQPPGLPPPQPARPQKTLTVDGIEVTQSIQFFRHNGKGSVLKPE